jgi:hypothetical protein
METMFVEIKYEIRNDFELKTRIPRDAGLNSKQVQNLKLKG